MMTDRESDFSESNESRRTKVETRRSPAFQARRHGADESASSESESDYYHSDDDHYADFATDHSDEDGSQGEDDSRERFDPTVGDQIDKLTGGMRDYVYKHFTRHIKDEVIKEKILKETPIPSNAVFTTPLMDDFVEELIDDKKAIMYTKIHDGSLKFVQKRIGHVMGPLSKIWKTVQKGVDGDESTSMGIDELLQLIEKTILLLGQANVACLYERRLNVLSKIFGDAKKARKSIFTNETLFIEGTQGKLLGEDYYKVLERHSKSRKRAREISDSLGKGKALKRRKTVDERRSYDQPQSQRRQPFRRGPSRKMQRGGRTSTYRRTYQAQRYAKRTSSKLSRIRGNSTKCSPRSFRPGFDKHAFMFKCKVPTSGGKTGQLHNELGNFDSGSSDPGCNKGIQNRICSKSSKILSKSSFFSNKQGKYEAGRKRNTGLARQECGRIGRISNNTQSGFEQYFHTTEERRRPEANLQSKGTEQTYSVSPFQNGGVFNCKKSHSKRGLHGESRFERCLPQHIDPRRSQKISEVFEFRGSNPTVQIPTVWIGVRPPPIHQNNEAFSSISKTNRHPSCDLLGRHTDNESKSRCAPERQRFINMDPSEFGFCDKLEKITTDTNPKSGVSRFFDRFSNDEGHTPRKQNSQDSGQVQSSSKQKRDNYPRTSQSCRLTKCIKRCNSANNTVCKRNANAPNQTASPCKKLPIKNKTKQSLQRRNKMVDKSCPGTQWQTVTDAQSRFDDRIRCIQSGMGSSMPRHEDGGPLVQGGKEIAHKCIGAKGSPPCSQICSKKQDRYASSYQDGQHNGSGTYKQNGGNKVPNPQSNNQRDMGILFKEGDNSHSRIPTRFNEHTGRLGESPCEVFIPMETECNDIQTIKQGMGANIDRSICRQVEQSNPSILQLETRPRGTGDRCIHETLGSTESICVSPILLDPESPSESNEGQSQNSDNHSFLANTSSLPNASEHGSRLSNSATANEEFVNISRGTGSSSDTRLNTQIGCMESIRGEAGARGLSHEATNLLVESWRKGTQTSYNTCWKYWSSWCCERNLDPIQAPVEHVANFLAELYDKGYAYSSINSYRSAISACHVGHNGTPIGQHNVICRLLLGIFNKRPPMPRYTCTWDVDSVLRYINSLNDNKVLTLKELTLKVTMLIALATACRSSEVSKLDMEYMSMGDDYIQFTLPTLTKSRRMGGKPISLTLRQFELFPKLDVVDCTKEYISKTQNLRGSQTILLISFIKPHKSVKPCTIAKWLQEMMSKSGIDVSKFKSHSTRSASTSKALKQGLSVAQIMKMANWKSENVFKRFYSNTIEGESGNNQQNFSDAVLNIQDK